MTIICLKCSTRLMGGIPYDYDNKNFVSKVASNYHIKERIYITEDRAKLSYLEGPDNGVPLLLIHGQMVRNKTMLRCFLNYQNPLMFSQSITIDMENQVNFQKNTPIIKSH